MAYINLSQTTKLNRLTVLNDMIGANASVVVYDGSYPVTPDQPVGANTLVTFACNPTTFGNVSVIQAIVSNTVSNTTSIANVVSLTSLLFPPALASANGIAGWARISDVNGNAVVDLDVGLANSGTSIVMNSTDLIANIPVQIVSIQITEQ
ncbi:unnamed protein product [Sphagnum tenellum]